MQLEIRGQATHFVECNSDDVIASLKERIASVEGLQESDIFLLTSTGPVDESALASAFLNTPIEIHVPLLGGKVHGSLARAGKVKGQTPKVEKQEKKKKKTGRAKRRIQYNRKFVNVVATFGRKKGPNSNS